MDNSLNALALFQLTESESQNLDLQQRVEVLEERLEFLNSCHKIEEQPEDYQQTIKAKDQFIEKLEKEQKQQTQEFNKMVCGCYCQQNAMLFCYSSKLYWIPVNDFY